MQTQEVIEGWRGVLVSVGLGTPMSRAITVGLAAGVLSYAIKTPGAAFRRDGSLRPSALLGSPEPDATGTHFLLIPAVVAGTTFLFT
jgi:hypothetical protein